MRADERGGDIFGAAFGEQGGGQFAVLIVKFDGFQQAIEQTLAVVVPNRLCRRRVDPLGADACSAQH